MQPTTIKNIKARYILDSRGNPTIETDIILNNGILGRAAVPSGASTGKYEALELKDKDKTKYLGNSVNNAIQNIHQKIKPLLINVNINNIEEIDNIMLEADGTSNKKNFGANSILGVSLSCLHAGAKANKSPLFSFINQLYPSKMTMPIPMMNILNGGVHADNSLDIQEFMIFPKGINTFPEALRAGTEIFHNLKSILKNKKYNTNIGDEGGFAPSLSKNEDAIELILEAIIKAGYIPEKEICLALDVAASEMYDKKKKLYNLQSENKELNSDELIKYYSTLCKKYPIVSIEDGLDEDDWTGWQTLCRKIGKEVQIVGDDLTVTNFNRLEKAISKKAINAILIKLNQIGTFTETMKTISHAKNHNLGVIVSHRSGETEDTTIADLAVATGSGQIKTGSLCRTDRTCKYNQLLRIEETIQNISYGK